ncbi:hypothetical protein HDU99_001775 [Rhizoclosmatium hyalinum]|nr:hypothetical protein HDU99_001775 [Rhizoclosmatium hyalinum]
MHISSDADSLVQSLRRHSVIFRRGQEPYHVPSTLNLELSPAALKLLQTDKVAREALDQVTMSVVAPDNLTVEAKTHDLQHFFERTSHGIKTVRFHYQQQHAKDVLAVPAILYLVPFPDLLLPYLKTLAPSQVSAALSAPIHHKIYKSNNQIQLTPVTALDVEKSVALSSLPLALYLNHTTSAIHLIEFGAKFDLNFLAFHLMKYPYTPDLMRIVAEFTKRAEADESLWKTVDDEGGTFLMMLARVDPVPNRNLDENSINNLFALLDLFLENVPDLARKDTRLRDPLMFMVLNNHKHLFEWAIRTSDHKIDFSVHIVTKIIISGHYQCFEWKGSDGKELVPAEVLSNMKLRIADKSLPLKKGFPFEHREWYCFEENGNFIPGKDLTIVAAQLIHAGIMHEDVVKYLANLKPSHLMRVREKIKGVEHEMSSTELALAVRADKAAMYLMGQEDIRCLLFYVEDRIKN